MADSTAASTVFKRAEQLRRWQSSDTNGQSPQPRVARRIHFPSEVEFLSACKTGDKDEIASFLAQGADINTTNPDGLTALHQACIDNDLEIVEFLVDQGAEVNCRDNDGWTPLHATASGGSLSIAKYLVSHDADVAAVNYDGDLPLDIALNDSMQNFLKTIMEDQGVDAEEARNAEINALRQDSLFWAEHGYDPEITDSMTGGSALHVCAAKGYIDVLQILLEACGADPNCVDYEGWTPLHAAALWGQQEAAQLLLKFGADPCLKNCNGLTCADIAHASVAQLLSETISRLALPNPSVTKNKRKLSPPRHGVKRADTQEASEPASKAINVEVKKTEKKTLTTIAPKNTHDAPVYPSTSGGTHVSEDSFRWRRSASYSTKQDPPEDGGVLHRSRSIDNDISSRLLNNPVSAPTKTPSSSQPPENSTPVDFKVVITEPDDDAKNDVHEKPRLTAKERRDKFYIWQQSVTSEPSPVLNKQAVVRRSFVPPTRDEESETQRKVNAKRVRETRRSTQGVTLDEIKSAEQLLKKKSSSSGPSTDSPTNGAFEIEDNDRATCPNPAPASAPIPEATATMTIPRAPAGSNANTTVSTMSPENNGIEPEENNKDNSATMERTNQSNPQTGLNLIQRRRRPKRRPTGVNPVEVDAVSDAGATGDSEVNNREAMQSDNESTEGGEKRDYKSLYEKAIEENKRLYELLASTDLQLRDALTTISAMSTLNQSSLSEIEKREKRAMERKLSEMEEELKIQSDLETENQRLKEENGALIRVISKLSK